MPTLASSGSGTLVEALAFSGRKDPFRHAAVVAAVDLGDGGLALNLRASRGDDAQVFGFSRYSKTVPTYAAKIMAPFRVDTEEGLMEGKLGDYLAIGVHGEMYPIDAEVMEASYVFEAPPAVLEAYGVEDDTPAEVTISEPTKDDS